MCRLGSSRAAAKTVFPDRPWRPKNDQPDTDGARPIEIALGTLGSCRDAFQCARGRGCAGVGSRRSARSQRGQQGSRTGWRRVGRRDRWRRRCIHRRAWRREKRAIAPGERAETGKGSKQAVLTQDGAPQLNAEQIVANSDSNIDRIKTELKLTPEQEKHWTGFNSAMHYLGHNGADRLNLRIARAKRDPPDDIIEQMRNEAQFLNDRAVDQRSVADAAEPLFASLDDKQKAIFIEEMVRLSHERGLD